MPATGMGRGDGTRGAQTWPGSWAGVGAAKISGRTALRKSNRGLGMVRGAPVAGSTPNHWDTACGEHSQSFATSDVPPKAAMICSEFIAEIKACFQSNKQACFLTHGQPPCKLTFVTYGERLNQAIQLAGSSRAAVAEAVGASVQAIGQVIRGDTVALTAENSARAAEALRVDHFWLATGEGEPRPKSKFPLSDDLLKELSNLDQTEIIRVENSVRGFLGMQPLAIPIQHSKQA